MINATQDPTETNCKYKIFLFLLNCVFDMNRSRKRRVTVVMEVFAGGDRVTASIVLQAAVYRGYHFFEALDSVTHVSR